MSNLLKIREQILKSFITKNLINQSIYPTLEMVCSILLRDYSGIDAGKSLIRDSHMVSYDEGASVKKANDTFQRADIDIETLYSFVDYIEEYLERSSRNASNKISTLNRMASSLEAEALSLLLANDDVNHNVEIFEENFEDSTNIDLDKTDAHIDYGNKYATSKNLTSDSLSYTDVLSVFLTSVTKGYKHFQPLDGSGLDKLSDKTGNPWIQHVIMPSSYEGNVEVSLKIKTSQSRSISRIFFEFTNAVPYYVQIIGLVDSKYTILSGYKEYVGFVDATFSPVDTSNIIINIRTNKNFGIVNSPQDGKLYKFGLKELMSGLNSYDSISTIYGKQHTSSRSFSSVSIFSDETVPDEAGIKYEITWDDTNWHNISPSNRSEIDYTQNVSVLANSILKKSIYGIDLSKLHPYLYDQNVSTSYTQVSLYDIGIINPRILRNLGGFFLDPTRNNLISTVLYVNGSSQEFNFSKYPGYLDGNRISTVYNIPSGFHTFKFNLNDGLDNFKTYLDSITSNDFYYGSHLASYRPEDIFINVTENNAYDQFTFVKVDGTYTATLKMLGEDIISDYDSDKEQFLAIENDIDQGMLDSLPNTIRTRITLESSQYNTPILRGFKIKVG